MKLHYLILILGCMILPINLFSQQLETTVKTELPCYNTQELFKNLREKYKELPILTGKTDDDAGSTMSVWMNGIDKDWTIIATKDELSCVIGTGTDLKLIPYKKGTSV